MLLSFLTWLVCLSCYAVTGVQGAIDSSDMERLKAFYCLLGVKSNDVQDSDIIATSSQGPKYRAHFARLDAVATAQAGGAWCADATSDHPQWIQIDLKTRRSVGGVVTQGSNGGDSNWVTSFKVACDSYISENGNEMVFVGNSDNNTRIFNSFPAPVTCRVIRIYPQSWSNAICMRLDILSGNCQGRKHYQFSLRSSGFDDRNLAEIIINGVDYALHRRGHNVVVVNAKTLGIDSRVFDTYGTETPVTEMMTYLEHIPYGSLIAIAIQDSTRSSYMDDAFMESLGAGAPDCAVRVEFRSGWAFVTEKIPPGSPFPEWKGCSHVLRYEGTATLNAAVDFGRFYYVEDIPMPT